MSDSYLTEEFRSVEGYPGYRASSFGRVQSCWLPGSRTFDETRWRDLKAQPLEREYGDPYWVVMLYRGGKYRHFLVHRLILETFAGPCPQGHVCCHGDDNPANNHLDNLRWDTRKANTGDAIRSGALRRGSRHGIAKLDEGRVAEIRRLRREGWQVRPLAIRFGVSVGTVSNVINDKIWKHVT